MATIVRFEALYAMLAQAALAGLVLLAIGSVAVLIVRQPARRIRVIEWTLVGLLIVPVLGLLPGYPRWGVLPKLEGASAELVDAPVVETPAMVPPAARVEVPFVAPMETPVGPIETPTFEPLPAETVVNEAPAVGPVPELEMPAAAQMIAAAEAQPSELQPSALEPPAILPAPRELDWNILADFRVWIVGAYAVGVAAMLAWSLVGLIAVKRLLRSRGRPMRRVAICCDKSPGRRATVWRWSFRRGLASRARWPGGRRRSC